MGSDLNTGRDFLRTRLEIEEPKKAFSRSQDTIWREPARTSLEVELPVVPGSTVRSDLFSKDDA